VGQTIAPVSLPEWIAAGASPRIIRAMGAADFLKRELTRRQARNPRYSLRAFARDLDCDHATLSQWLRGTRELSPAAQHHVFVRLDLAPDERARARELDDEDLRVLDAIKSELSTIPEIAAAAAVSPDRANVALAKLLRLEVVRLEQSRWHVLENVQ
jgi:transcriptional regulator with XRE-family HTH domain